MLGGLAWALSAAPVWAVLGQAPSGQAPPLAAPDLYVLSAVSLASGAVIKEFSGPDGLVFAVSWRGPVLPDLSVLLGSYYATFNQANEEARASGRRGSPLSIARDGLVVQAGGRSPHLFGYAYIAHLVPAGIQIKDVVQ